jgi:hypothetical protein
MFDGVFGAVKSFKDGARGHGGNQGNDQDGEKMSGVFHCLWIVRVNADMEKSV